jgi:hypothetical protein
MNRETLAENVDFTAFSSDYFNKVCLKSIKPSAGYTNENIFSVPSWVSSSGFFDL